MDKATTATSEKINPDDPASVYFHIPFCTAKCDYCGFYSVPAEDHDPAALVDCLLRQLDGYCLTKGSIETVFIGGGSPSCLGDQLIRLAEAIVCRLGDVAEFTVEANPEQINDRLLGDLRQAGANRLSLGAQSFNQKELDALGRKAAVKDIDRALAAARQADFDNINLDLIFAIPSQTIDSWLGSLRTAIDLDVEHIAAYSLSFEPDAPYYHKRLTGEITPIDDELDRKMYELAIETLTNVGIRQYEISNFARNGFQCRHNLAYWNNLSYLGVGPAAGSFYRGRRLMNVADIDKYINAVRCNGSIIVEDVKPTARELACQCAVLMLRKTRGLDLEQYRRQCGYDARELFADQIKHYLKTNCLTFTDANLALTPAALPIADSILCDFAD